MVLHGCKTCHCCQYLRAEWMVANLWQSRCGSRRCCHSNLWRQARHHLQCLRGELQLGRRPSLCLPNHVGFHFHAQHHNIQIRHLAGRNDVSPDFAQQTTRCQELHNGEVGSQWSDGANCHALALGTRGPGDGAAWLCCRLQNDLRQFHPEHDSCNGNALQYYRERQNLYWYPELYGDVAVAMIQPIDHEGNRHCCSTFCDPDCDYCMAATFHIDGHDESCCPLPTSGPGLSRYTGYSGTGAAWNPHGNGGGGRSCDYHCDFSCWRLF